MIARVIVAGAVNDGGTDRGELGEGNLPLSGPFVVSAEEVWQGVAIIKNPFMKPRFVRRVWAVGARRRVALMLSPLAAPLRSPPRTARASGETRADYSASGNRKNFTEFSCVPEVSD
jgi:hypothetical protein